MKEKILKALDFIGGKTIYLILVGIVVGIFLIAGIIVNVSNSEKSSSGTNNHVSGYVHLVQEKYLFWKY